MLRHIDEEDELECTTCNRGFLSSATKNCDDAAADPSIWFDVEVPHFQDAREETETPRQTRQKTPRPRRKKSRPFSK